LKRRVATVLQRLLDCAKLRRATRAPTHKRATRGGHSASEMPAPVAVLSGGAFDIDDDEEMTAPSALAHSLLSKRDKSYYYAHERVGTTEMRAPAPAPGGLRLHPSCADSHAAGGPEHPPARAACDLADKSAYYYAHAKRNTSETPAPMPQAGGWVLDKQAHAAELPLVTIQNYSFLDEDSVVKVYLPLDDVKDRVKPEDVTSTFGERSFDINIKGYDQNSILRFGCPCLHAEIDVSGSTHRILRNKVVVILKKLTLPGQTPRKWRLLK